MKKIITTSVRIFVALNFIFSGFVKLVDPVGTQIKMEEYFEVLHLDFLVPYALAFSVFLIVLEWTLGWWLLLQLRIHTTVYALTVLTVFFLFLTGFSAVTGKVTDCGCFGDAIKLTPWETFYKNVVYLLMLGWLIYRLKDCKTRKISLSRLALAYVFPVAALIFAVWTVKHLPVIDFRPYAVGKNIKEGMQIPPGAKPYIFKDIWYYKVNGEVKAYATEDKPWEIPGAEFVKRKTVEVQKGYDPPVKDFTIEGDWGDITGQVLDKPAVYLILITDPEKLDDRDYKNLMQTVQKLKESKSEFYLVTADITPKLERWSRTVDTPVNFMDKTTLKTMIRTKAGVMYLEKATVKGKWTLRDFLKSSS